MEANQHLRVSVVIPAYNAAAFIDEALESALSQTHPPTEVIVVDDGSSDDTGDVVRAAYGDSVHLVRQPNGGVSSARNAGMRAATGDFLAFLDADDVWYPTKLEAQLAAFAKFPQSDLCYTEARLSTGHVRGLSYPVFRNHSWGYADIFEESKTVSIATDDLTVYAGDIFRYLLYNGMILPSSVLIRRSFLEKHGISWDTELGRKYIIEDSLFFMEAAQKTWFTFIDAPLLHYRTPVGEHTRLSANTNNPNRITGFIKGIERIARESGTTDADPAWLNHCLAHSHRRLGYYYLSELQLLQARASLRTAARHEPGDLQTYLFLLAAFLPAWAVRLLGHLKRGRSESSEYGDMRDGGAA